jgi:alkylation response protein AidB-like acyl-CoA dehydrogenase
MIIGEGTNEIQRTLIARQLVERHGERLGALTSREGEPEERRQMVLAVRQFVEKSVVPVAAEHDAAARYPADVVAELAELGVLGAPMDPRYGGLGLDGATLAMLLEELARGWTTIGAAVAAHVSVAWALDRFAPAAVRERLLPSMARGERLATITLGGDVRVTDDGGLHGASALADNAPRAALFLVRARGHGAAPALALVERDTPGARVGAMEAPLGGRGLDPGPLVLDGARPAVMLTGADAAVVAFATTAAAAVAVGVAQAAFEAALRYSQQRTTFGKPLCQHQAVQLKLADMATDITAARLLTSRAAQAERDVAAAAMARLHAAAAALHATLETMRIHGGYGYVSEFPVERYYRDAARLAFVPLDDDALRALLAERVVRA